MTEQLKRIPDQVLPEELAGRKDLRELQTVTIDGEEAKDLDDAITIKKRRADMNWVSISPMSPTTSENTVH